MSISARSRRRAACRPSPFQDVDNSTDFAWGVGGQVRFDQLAVRLEYEQFDIPVHSGFDSPRMLSLGASWTFF